MTLHLNTLRRIAKRVTSRQVSERALYFLSVEAEQWITDALKDAEHLLDERNSMRKINGMYTKVRITEEIIAEVLKGRKSIRPSPDKSPVGGTNGRNTEESTSGAGDVDWAALIEMGRNNP